MLLNIKNPKFIRTFRITCITVCVAAGGLRREVLGRDGGQGHGVLEGVAGTLEREHEDHGVLDGRGSHARVRPVLLRQDREDLQAGEAQRLEGQVRELKLSFEKRTRTRSNKRKRPPTQMHCHSKHTNRV